jgi:hypothetical protein
VSKHLKLSVRVAEELNTKQFVEQSMMNKVAIEEKSNDNMDQNQKLLKLYNSQDAATHE